MVLSAQKEWTGFLKLRIGRDENVPANYLAPHTNSWLGDIFSSTFDRTRLTGLPQSWLSADRPLAQFGDLRPPLFGLQCQPDLLIALESQSTPFALKVPPNWPTKPSGAALRKWGALHLPIQLVLLPTYASWLNPIEKLWRYLKQEVVHLHPFANDLAKLRSELDRFLDRFALGSNLLLRYVGLFTD